MARRLTALIASLISLDANDRNVIRTTYPWAGAAQNSTSLLALSTWSNVKKYDCKRRGIDRGNRIRDTRRYYANYPLFMRMSKEERRPSAKKQRHLHSWRSFTVVLKIFSSGSAISIELIDQLSVLIWNGNHHCSFFLTHFSLVRILALPKAGSDQ